MQSNAGSHCWVDSQSLHSGKHRALMHIWQTGCIPPIVHSAAASTPPPPSSTTPGSPSRVSASPHAGTASAAKRQETVAAMAPRARCMVGSWKGKGSEQHDTPVSPS
jgi:hypothetical protein